MVLATSPGATRTGCELKSCGMSVRPFLQGVQPFQHVRKAIVTRRTYAGTLVVG